MKKILEQWGEVSCDVDLKKYNTYGIGGKTKFLLKPYNYENLKKLLVFLKENSISYYLLGMGSNVILPDADFDGVIIKLDNFQNIDFKDNYLIVGAGLPLNTLIQKTLSLGYTNLAYAAGVPGTIGAAVVGNVGCFKHEIMEDVLDVTFLDENLELRTLSKKNLKYSYRNTELKNRHVIVIAISLRLIKGNVLEARETIKKNWQYRLLHQPIGTKNAGSVFKNPEGYAAGKLIEDIGFKAKRIGDAEVSAKHANFIVNIKDAKSKDILALIKQIKEEVKKKYNLELELEQIVVNWS